MALTGQLTVLKDVAVRFSMQFCHEYSFSRVGCMVIV